MPSSNKMLRHYSLFGRSLRFKTWLWLIRKFELNKKKLPDFSRSFSAAAGFGIPVSDFLSLPFMPASLTVAAVLAAFHGKRSALLAFSVRSLRFKT
ncbi:MAG: hypothetical protein K6E78_06780 [Treponema sp.]|nr:hypothetical protein [Treponema sp.]